MKLKYLINALSIVPEYLQEEEFFINIDESSLSIGVRQDSEHMLGVILYPDGKYYTGQYSPVIPEAERLYQQKQLTC